MRFRDFLSELRRRHVVRLALIYMIVGWVVIQAADTIFPRLAIPDWAVSLVVILVLLGFPVALVLSWMFDVTPAGVKRTEQPAGSAAAVTGERPAERVRTPREKSIAVLPFVDMSADGDSEFFSDGITEEILNALTKVRELQVASRTSAFAFKGKELDVPGRRLAGAGGGLSESETGGAEGDRAGRHPGGGARGARQGAGLVRMGFRPRRARFAAGRREQSELRRGPLRPGRSGGLIYLHLDPSYDPLRADPRLTGLVKRIGLRTG